MAHAEVGPHDTGRVGEGVVGAATVGRRVAVKNGGVVEFAIGGDKGTGLVGGILETSTKGGLYTCELLVAIECRVGIAIPSWRGRRNGKRQRRSGSGGSGGRSVRRGEAGLVDGACLGREDFRKEKEERKFRLTVGASCTVGARCAFGLVGHDDGPRADLSDEPFVNIFWR